MQKRLQKTEKNHDFTEKTHIRVEDPSSPIEGSQDILAEERHGIRRAIKDTIHFIKQHPTETIGMSATVAVAVGLGVALGALLHYHKKRHKLEKEQEAYISAIQSQIRDQGDPTVLLLEDGSHVADTMGGPEVALTEVGEIQQGLQERREVPTAIIEAFETIKDFFTTLTHHPKKPKQKE